MLVLCGPRQPGQGGGGAGRPVRQPRSRTCPRPPGCPWPGCTRERHRPPGLRGGRRRRWASRGRAPPTWPWWPPTTARAVAAAGVFTANLATAAPVQVSRAHLAATGGRAAAVVLTSGNANAATGARGRRGRRTAVRSWPARRSGPSPTEVLVCQTGLIGVPFPIDVGEPRGPRRGGRQAGRPGRRRRQRRPRHHDHRHGGQGGPGGRPASGGGRSRVGGHGQGGGHAGPRTWPPCWRC